MANIYNKFTKKKVFNAKWAPKGKFWYVKGRPQKYYPSKGWQNSIDESDVSSGLDDSFSYRRGTVKAATKNQVPIQDTGVRDTGVIDAGIERDYLQVSDAMHRDSNIPLGFFYQNYKFEKDVWNYYQKCIRTSRKLIVKVLSVPQYELYVFYPFGWAHDGYSTNGTTWVQTSMRGPAMLLVDPATAIAEYEYLEVTDAIELLALHHSFYKYYIGFDGRVRYGSNVNGTYSKGELLPNPSGAAHPGDYVQTLFFNMNRRWIIKAFMENAVEPMISIIPDLQEGGDDTEEGQGLYVEIPDLYMGYVDMLGVYVPAGFEINYSYTVLYHDYLEDVGIQKRDYIVCDIVFKVDEFQLWAQEQDLVNFFGFSIGRITNEVLDSIKVVLPRVRCFGQQKTRVPTYQELVDQYKRTRAYEVYVEYVGAEDVDFLYGAVDPQPAVPDVEDFPKLGLGGRIGLGLLTGGLSEIFIGIDTLDESNQPTPPVNVASGTTPLLIVPLSIDVYRDFTRKLIRYHVLDGNLNPTGLVGGY